MSKQLPTTGVGNVIIDGLFPSGFTSAVTFVTVSTPVFDELKCLLSTKELHIESLASSFEKAARVHHMFFLFNAEF